MVETASPKVRKSTGENVKISAMQLFLHQSDWSTAAAAREKVSFE